MSRLSDAVAVSVFVASLLLAECLYANAKHAQRALRKSCFCRPAAQRDLLSELKYFNAEEVQLKSLNYTHGSAQ